jgi:hypothetical protein
LYYSDNLSYVYPKQTIIMKKIFFIALFALLSLKLTAQGTAQGGQNVQPAVVQVVNAYADGNTADKSAGLSEILVVSVRHLSGWLKANPNATVSQLRLFVNCLEIEGSAPIGWCARGDDMDLKFLLQRNEANNKTWNTLLGFPVPGPEYYYMPVAISVGPTGKGPVASTVNAFTFIRIYRGWFWGGIVFLAIYLFILGWLAIKTPMLRDAPADLTPLGIPGVSAGSSPYSLGKTQMAFWFSIILASYVFIWLVTDNYDVINSGTLVLIGIGAGTGLGAISIGNNKDDGTIKQIQTLQAQQSDLRQSTELLKANPGPGIDGKVQYNQFLDNQMTAKINEMITNLRVTKDNFFSDLLTDANGVSFHRLQMVVFTLVLGLVFIYSVWASLTMPDFSATLLTMQGITAGTYLGFKMPEKQG